MTEPSFTPTKKRLVLKEIGGWFAAGDPFRNALNLLSDGAFKLFAFLCLEADRHSGLYRGTQKDLAAALGKSNRIIGAYVAELQVKGICGIVPGKNQFAPTVFKISDRYWPYHRSGSSVEPEKDVYVESVREWFLALGCGPGKFSAADGQLAKQMQMRAIPLSVIKDAMLLGVSRKYSSWLNGGALEPIRSIRYFEPLIAEVKAQPLPPGYSAYLRQKIRQLERNWKESIQSRQSPSQGGCPDMGSIEIVQ